MIVKRLLLTQCSLLLQLERFDIETERLHLALALLCTPVMSVSEVQVDCYAIVSN